MCGTCGCKSAESGKKNCGCGQDPCITYGAETFEARENKDGTIVLDGREMANTTPLANGNYLFFNKELKWIENNLKSGSEKFHLVKVHSDDVVRCINSYETIIRNPTMRRRPPHLDGEKHQRWLKNYRQKLAKNAETFEARTTRKGGKHDPTKTVRDGTFIYTDKVDGIQMDYDNQKVRKLGKDLRRQGVPLKIKTKNAEIYPDEDEFYDELDKKIEAKEKEIRDFKEYLEKVGHGRRELMELESLEQELDELENTEYPEMVHCSFCSKIIGTEEEVYDEESVEWYNANGETICPPCHKRREQEYKNDLDPHYSPFYAETPLEKEVKKYGLSIEMSKDDLIAKKLERLKDKNAETEKPFWEMPTEKVEEITDIGEHKAFLPVSLGIMALGIGLIYKMRGNNDN